MGFKDLSIRTKLILTFVTVGLGPLLVSNAVSYVESSKEIELNAAERAKLVTLMKSETIKSYFLTETNGIVDLSADRLTVAALDEFSAPFAAIGTGRSQDWDAKYRSELAKFYVEQFGKSYREKTKQSASAENIVANLDSATVVAQYDFIANNENPLGQKDVLVTPKRDGPYAKAHTKYHTFFRNYLQRHGLYDVFLVSPEGRVVYTVFKEVDFATSLTQGPWRDTGLARAFNEGMKLEKGKVFIADFASYKPSYEAPASFAATPIFNGEKRVGTLVVQLPLDRITLAAQNRDGLSERDEVLLLGSDLKLRADSFRNKATHTVAADFDPNSKVDVGSEAVKRASSGETGHMRNVSYDGLKTLAYYMPIKIENLTWYVVTELDEADVFAGLRKLTMISLAILAIGLVTVLVVAFAFGGSIAKSLKSIVDSLHHSSGQLSSASVQSATSATQLSEASTEQAASLQETMASIEEISAMVQQNADSATRAQSSVTANEAVVQEGSKGVDEMLVSIDEIRTTNEEILEQMENSNREFGEIGQIIAEIAQKTNVINDIVFQTKLLSFNASVEAARAGDHGKGFAVVAEEVGSLAQMSGNAAKEISEMLTGSVSKVDTIITTTKVRVDKLVEKGRSKIDEGRRTAERCRAALDKVTENARVVASMTVEIAHASKEQSQGVKEINTAISQLDQVTQQNATVAQQSSAQAEQLRRQADDLRAAVRGLVVFSEGSGTAKEEVVVTAPQEKEKSVASVVKVSTVKTPVPVPVKRVAGSDVVSSDDPRFEDL